MFKWAAICYAKLPFLQKNTNNSDIWFFYFKNVLKNANQILNELFEDHEPSSGLNETSGLHFLTFSTCMRLISKLKTQIFYYFSRKRFECVCQLLFEILVHSHEQTVGKFGVLFLNYA